MRSKILVFYKITISIFIAFFVLSFTSLKDDGVFLNPSIAEASDTAIGFTTDNPGIKKAKEVQSRHSLSLMGIAGVVGHGVGVSSEGEPVIKIFVERAGIPGIPAALEGIPTKVEVTGMVIAYADPTAYFPRPVPIGVSTGHPDITAGTIGCRVKDASGNVYALSNNHVYANQNDANVGDSALQPGPYDGGHDPADAIGTLDAFEPIDFSGGGNTIDAAIAITSELDCSTPNGDGYGTPSSTTEPATPGLDVQKYGRTTGWTHGEVATINTTVDVCYETKGFIFVRCIKEARFVNQIGITPGTFSAGGDSGSLIVTDDANKYPVGLLFAGSNTHTFANPIELVLQRFVVTVDDCSGTSLTTYYLDNDGDGYGDPNHSVDSESQPLGYVLDNTDCNDADPSINPGATEVCDDGVDNNCDGLTDQDDFENCPTPCYDVDSDSYEDKACGGTDCNDADPSINPGATEVCDDGVDNNCDGNIDEGCSCLDVGARCRSDSDCCSGDCRGKCR